MRRILKLSGDSLFYFKTNISRSSTMNYNKLFVIFFVVHLTVKVHGDPYNLEGIYLNGKNHFSTIIDEHWNNTVKLVSTIENESNNLCGKYCEIERNNITDCLYLSQFKAMKMIQDISVWHYQCCFTAQYSHENFMRELINGFFESCDVQCCSSEQDTSSIINSLKCIDQYYSAEDKTIIKSVQTAYERALSMLAHYDTISRESVNTCGKNFIRTSNKTMSEMKSNFNRCVMDPTFVNVPKTASEKKIISDLTKSTMSLEITKNISLYFYENQKEILEEVKIKSRHIIQEIKFNATYNNTVITDNHNGNSSGIIIDCCFKKRKQQIDEAMRNTQNTSDRCFESIANRFENFVTSIVRKELRNTPTCYRKNPQEAVDAFECSEKNRTHKTDYQNIHLNIFSNSLEKIYPSLLMSISNCLHSVIPWYLQQVTFISIHFDECIKSQKSGNSCLDLPLNFHNLTRKTHVDDTFMFNTINAILAVAHEKLFV